jgi:hypothetical protein
MVDELDDDVAAITTLISVLKPLEPQARIHILDFVFKRLGISFPAAERAAPAASSPLQPAPAALPPVLGAPAGPTVDIRGFADEKNPKTVNEKVAVVAYYLAQLAPPAERKDQIGADDIQPYFIQAGFALPTSPGSMTLTNAKNAGYLNALERGQYRLNAVGHNLVAHKLPMTENSGSKRKNSKRAANKKAAKKKPRPKSKK